MKHPEFTLFNFSASKPKSSLAESDIKPPRGDFSAGPSARKGSCDLFLLQNANYNFGTSKTQLHNFRAKARPTSVILKLLRNEYTHQSTGIKMRVQFVAAVIVGLTLIPVRVFGCTCAAPTAPVKTASELAWRIPTTQISIQPEAKLEDWR